MHRRIKPAYDLMAQMKRQNSPLGEAGEGFNCISLVYLMGGLNKATHAARLRARLWWVSAEDWLWLSAFMTYGES